MSNVNGKQDKKQLDPKRMKRLKATVFLYCPLEPKEDEKKCGGIV